ncbi:MAG: DUF3892 domain-containing protein [Vicinamibacterales bacterium]
MPLRVRCINKTDRHSAWERISDFGGYNPDGSRWKLSLAKMISAIESNQHGEVYVERPAGDRVRCIVSVSASGNKYVKTVADGDMPNNLLSLPECP